MQRRRGAQPANVNAMKRPWSVVLRRGAFTAAQRALLAKYVGDLSSDKPDATETERRVMEAAALARLCVYLILNEAQARGFVRVMDATWDLAPGAKELPRFLGKEVEALRLLGLARREKEPAFEDYFTTDTNEGNDA